MQDDVTHRQISSIDASQDPDATIGDISSARSKTTSDLVEVKQWPDSVTLIPDGAGLSCPGSSVVAEGARFETPDDTETIGPELTALVLSQSFTKAGGR